MPSNVTETTQTPVGSLAQAVERLAAATSLEEIIETLRGTARHLLGSDGVALIMRDGDLCHYVGEDAVGPLWRGRKFPMAACISGWSMLKRQTVCIPDIEKDRRITQDLYADTFVRSLVMTPIGEDPPIGALGAYWQQEYAATPEEVDTLQALARATAVAIESIRDGSR